MVGAMLEVRLQREMSGSVYATLGPSGTCHDAALQAYLLNNRIENPRIQFVEDFIHAIDLLAEGQVNFVIQGCAHPQVATSIERHFHKVAMIDTFLYPTKPLALISRRGSNRRTLGLMPVTKDYLDLRGWAELVYESSNAIVAKKMEMGVYDGAITFATVAEEHPERFEILEMIGEIQMAWLVYGPIHLRPSGFHGLEKVVRADVTI
jgi:hypothetical protein